MNNKVIFIAILCILFVLVCPLISVSEGEELELLVKYKENNNIFFIQSIQSIRTVQTKDVIGIEKIGIKKIKAKTKEELDSLLKELKNDPNIEYVEPNIIYSKTQIPNDTYYFDDWAIDYIRAESAWDITTGSNDIIVAVIDTGVDMDHPDLRNQLILGKDFVDNDMIPEDEDGHGTLVAEIIGAEANNGFGKAGVVWNCKILPLRVLDANGDGYIEDIANAIIYAADNGARVINLSLGGPEPSRTIKDAIDYAYNKGVLLVGSAGNSGENILYPAAYSEVIAVGAIDENENRANFSGYGQQLSLVAPGVNIIGFENDEQLILGNGTSFATPYVSGGAALLLSLNPYLTNSEVKEMLEVSAKDLGLVGWDEDYGYGALDIYSALANNTEYFGDFNKDNIIDIYDLVLISKFYGKTSDDGKYDELYDFNKDGVINLIDLQHVSRNYGIRF